MSRVLIYYANKIVKDEKGNEIFDFIDFIEIVAEDPAIDIIVARKVTELVNAGKLVTGIEYKGCE